LPFPQGRVNLKNYSQRNSFEPFAPAAAAAQRWSDDHLLMFLRHISKMPQYFLEPAMPLAMAASPNIAISGYNLKRVPYKFKKERSNFYYSDFGHAVFSIINLVNPPLN
jgi:hypothetical protein